MVSRAPNTQIVHLDKLRYNLPLILLRFHIFFFSKTNSSNILDPVLRIKKRFETRILLFYYKNRLLIGQTNSINVINLFINLVSRNNSRIDFIFFYKKQDILIIEIKSFVIYKHKNNCAKKNKLNNNNYAPTKHSFYTVFTSDV